MMIAKQMVETYGLTLGYVIESYEGAENDGSEYWLPLMVFEDKEDVEEHIRMLRKKYNEHGGADFRIRRMALGLSSSTE